MANEARFTRLEEQTERIDNVLGSVKRKVDEIQQQNEFVLEGFPTVEALCQREVGDGTETGLADGGG